MARKTLIKNIQQLIGTYESAVPTILSGKDMQTLPFIDDAWLLIENGLIADFGSMATCPDIQDMDLIDAKDRLVLPAWLDTHTHLVFAETRELEFVDRIKGLSYADIAKRGGGILNSAAKLAQLPEEVLFDRAWERLMNVMAQGTGAIEIKSGYGLDVENELKMLRVIHRIQQQAPIPVRITFLAAHAYPPEYLNKKSAYIDYIIDTMLPAVEALGFVDYIDVFCEDGFFSVLDSKRILHAGQAIGLKAKIHANQLNHSGGVELGIEINALSVDHLECVGAKEIDALKGSRVMPVLLPGAAFFLGMHFQPARAIIDAGLPVCIASDYNPGSCPAGNMNTMMTLACTQMKMTPEEVINAMTINAAYACEWTQMGAIAKGYKANLILTKPYRHYYQLPYDYGNNPVEQLIIGDLL